MSFSFFSFYIYFVLIYVLLGEGKLGQREEQLSEVFQLGQ